MTFVRCAQPSISNILRISKRGKPQTKLSNGSSIKHLYSQEEIMQLIYRGNTYDYDPSMSASQPFQMVRNPGAAYDLIYRGTTYRVDPSVKLKEVPKSVESHKLIYRGLVYYTNITTQVEAKPELAIAGITSGGMALASPLTQLQYDELPAFDDFAANISRSFEELSFISFG
jgi:hypothetical protein